MAGLCVPLPTLHPQKTFTSYSLPVYPAHDECAFYPLSIRGSARRAERRGFDEVEPCCSAHERDEAFQAAVVFADLDERRRKQLLDKLGQRLDRARRGLEENRRIAGYRAVELGE